jgi:hypothetical protein
MQNARLSLAQAAKRLVAALQRETALARTGALPDLSAAGEAKREAFAEFNQACAEHDSSTPLTTAEHNAMRAVLTAANESALVLDAVKAALANFAEGLRNAARTAGDSGTYHLVDRARHHVLPLQFDASI